MHSTNTDFTYTKEKSVGIQSLGITLKDNMVIWKHTQGSNLIQKNDDKPEPKNKVGIQRRAGIEDSRVIKQQQSCIKVSNELW